MSVCLFSDFCASKLIIFVNQAKQAEGDKCKPRATTKKAPEQKKDWEAFKLWHWSMCEYVNMCIWGFAGFIWNESNEVKRSLLLGGRTSTFSVTFLFTLPLLVGFCTVNSLHHHHITSFASPSFSSFSWNAASAIRPVATLGLLLNLKKKKKSPLSVAKFPRWGHIRTSLCMQRPLLSRGLILPPQGFLGAVNGSGFGPDNRARQLPQGTKLDKWYA